MKNSGPVVAVPDFQPDHHQFGGCDGAYFGQKSPGILSLNNRVEARIVKVSPPA